MSEIKNIYEIKKVNLGINDVLIVRLPEGTDRNVLESFEKYLRLALPDHSELKKILVMAGDIEFQVIGVESIDDIILDKQGG